MTCAVSSRCLLCRGALPEMAWWSFHIAAQARAVPCLASSFGTTSTTVARMYDRWLSQPQCVYHVAGGLAWSILQLHVNVRVFGGQDLNNYGRAPISGEAGAPIA